MDYFKFHRDPNIGISGGLGVGNGNGLGLPQQSYWNNGFSLGNYLPDVRSDSSGRMIQPRGLGNKKPTPSTLIDEEPESDMSKYLGYLGGKDKVAGVGGIASGVASGVQGVMSLVQGGKLKDEANKIDTTRPIYRYSSGIDENVANARQAYSSGQMAGQNEMQNQIQANQSNNVSQLLNSGLDPSQLTAMALGSNQNTNTALNSMGMQKANFINQSRGALGQALGQQAQYKDQQFGYNVDEPYRERVARKNALLQKGNEASNTGMDKLISGGVGAGIGVASLLI